MDEAGEAEAVAAFAATVGAPGAAVDLLRAAIVVGLVVRPRLDVEGVVATVESLAREIHGQTGPLQDGTAGIRALNTALLAERGYRGDERHYEDPRNCFIHEVVDRRLGIPITLSILYMAVGRRLGLTLEGVGFPAHFLVRAGADPGEFLYVDPFNGGRILDRDALAAVLARQGAAPEQQLDLYLAAVTPRQVLDRVLNNIKARYLQLGDHRVARVAVNLKLVLAPWDLDEVRDRGLIAGYLGDSSGAVADLEAYLAHRAEAADAARVQARLIEIKAGL